MQIVSVSAIVVDDAVVVADKRVHSAQPLWLVDVFVHCVMVWKDESITDSLCIFVQIICTENSVLEP